MAFALTKFEARGVKFEGPVPEKRAKQEVVLTITGLSTDVDLDIGSDAGTFWTDAEADSTYGDLATEALAKLQDIVSKSAALLSVKSQQLLDRNTLVALDSDASSGGAASETLTVTGLLTTDKILSATIVEDGANAAYIQEAAKTCATDDEYVVKFNTDPGAGAEVRVLAERESYSVAIENKRPNITAHTATGETSYTIVLEYELNDEEVPTVITLGA